MSDVDASQESFADLRTESLENELFMLTRRNFLFASGAAGIAAATLGFYTWQVEPHWVEFVHRSLPIRDLPASLRGCSLVQFSDVHVGDVDDSYMIDVFQRTAELQPDIVVFTGDLISCYRGVLKRMPTTYAHVPQGRLATLATLGNHDYGPRWAHPKIAARVAAIMNGFGVTVLSNQVREVAGLHIVGLDDLLAKRFDPKPVAALAALEAPTLVLSHNPDTVDLPGWGNYKGWILSGHTHGGQCKPPFFRPPLLPCRNKRYTAGEFSISGGRRLYINRGVGHLLPVRFNVRPEVTVFELQRA